MTALLSIAPYKGTRIPESGEFLLPPRKTFSCGIWNRDPTTTTTNNNNNNNNNNNTRIYIAPFP